MTDNTKSTLRFWAIASAFYSLLVGGSAIGLLPWKTPGINVVFVMYAAVHLVAAVGLLWRPRVGYRLALLGAGLGVLACGLVCGGLIASFVYLQGVFGDFGLGASVGALLFASVALQVLGLYPALLARSLLRREIRSDMGVSSRVVGLFGALVVVPLILGIAFGLAPRASELEPLGEKSKRVALDYLRARLVGDGEAQLGKLEGIPSGSGPLFVTIWRSGRIRARVQGEGRDMARALEDAGDKLEAVGLSTVDKVRGSIKIDRVVSIASVPFESSAVIAMSVNPGLDGLRRTSSGETRTVLPDDMLRANIFGAAPLVPGIRELRIGASPRWIRKRIGDGGGDLERLRFESWMELDGEAIDVARGNTVGFEGGSEAWRRAAIAGGDYILGQIREDGRFHYIYRPMSDRNSSGGEYSLPRHSGTIYSLALLYGHTGDERFKRGATRAIAWLEEKIPARCGSADTTCIASDGEAWLGSTALTMVGMLEYQRQTGDSRYEETIEKLARFVLGQQRENGDFDHLFLVDENRADPGPRKMFFSEEAALALVMAHEVLGDDRYLEAAERALDYLTGPKYDYFLGWFVYGADHWTCIAANEAWPRLASRRYLEFCTEYSRFMARLQYEPDSWDNADFEGHYGFGALMAPQAPAAAGFTEAVISTYELARKHGEEDDELFEQISLALNALARDQIRKGNTYLMKRQKVALGGIRRSLVEQEVRIDFTQHAASALIRGAAI